MTFPLFLTYIFLIPLRLYWLKGALKFWESPIVT